MIDLSQKTFEESKDSFKYKIVKDKQSLMQRLCCCSPDSDSDEEPKYRNIGEQKKQIKPYGLFGYKSYEEVVDEI